MSRKHRTAAYRLFHYRYRVYMPRIFLYSREYLDKMGMNVSGDPDLDQARLMEPDLLNQTVAGLAMLHAEGAPIQFFDHTDIPKAYADIQEHLIDWENAIRRGIHISDVPPIEEFRQLEAVAQALYSSAKYFEPEEKVGGLRDLLMEFNRQRAPKAMEYFHRQRLMGEDGELKPYVSIVDRIERQLLDEYTGGQHDPRGNRFSRRS